MSVGCCVKRKDVVALMFLFVVKNELATLTKKLQRKFIVVCACGNIFQKFCCFCTNNFWGKKTKISYFENINEYLNYEAA
jgi:hypothetical protein